MIVVVGLAFEARIAARSGLNVICSGDGRELKLNVRRAIAAGCRGLISFGVAGGLKADLQPGTCIIASAILVGGNKMPTDRNWSQKLLQSMPGAIHGPLAGSESPVATSTAKHALHRETGAIAVDTESHVVAAAAAEHGLPMVAIRVICDPVGRTLPALALAAIRPDGSTNVPALLKSLARRPHDAPGLLMTALDARAARATLVRGSRLLVADIEALDSDGIPGGVLDVVTTGLGSAVG